MCSGSSSLEDNSQNHGDTREIRWIDAKLKFPRGPKGPREPALTDVCALRMPCRLFR